MTLGDVHVNKDGTIRFNGDPIGWVSKVDDAWKTMGSWRAEIGDAGDPEAWPPYRAVYAKTRKAAIVSALADIEVPS
jgi:hypothetical protein